MHSRTNAAILGTLFLALAPAPETQAAPFRDITYDLGGSSAILTRPLLGATSAIPPEMINGVMTIRYTSDSASGLATGPVELLSFNLSVYEVFTPGGTSSTLRNLVTLRFELLRPTGGVSAGQRLAGGTITPLGASARFGVTGTIHCYELCTALSLSATTPTLISPAAFTAPLPRLTEGATFPLHSVAGTVSGIAFDLSPYAAGVGSDLTGTLFLVGREVVRCPVGSPDCCFDDCPPVPEPGTLPLLAGGLATLGLGSAAWRLRARG